MREQLAAAILLFDAGVLLYFIVINTIYLLFCLVAYARLRQHRRRWTPRRLEEVLRSPATPGIYVIAPAYNEAATIGESLRSLLMLHYPEFEVIVVNDGSTDRTLEVARQEFSLLAAPVAYAHAIKTADVKHVYRSLAYPDLVVIDKANGGKADAINAGINAARYGIVCVIDADSLLEDHALTRAVLPFLEDPDTIAAGGIVRVVNGCRVEAGRVMDVRLPRNWLARFQVVEYLRAFLAGRVAQSAYNGLLIISGAFGVFRRDALLQVGGFRRDTIGEDMEIVTRLHRVYRDQRRRYRIVFQPDPVCWTEVPESIRVLRNQRNRWQRGTMQVLGYHRGLCGRPRYGAVGLLAMPYYVLFEAAGPLIEASGYVVTAGALAFGLLDWRFAELLFVAAVLYGALISLAAVLLEELSFRRYPRLRDLLALAGVGVLENFGYRQLTMWWRLRGVFDYLRNKQGWGTMTRKGFSVRGFVLAIAGALSISMAALDGSRQAAAVNPDEAVRQWRVKHEADYRRNFATIAGLHELKAGANTAGSARSNDVVLPPSTPARIGRFVLEGSRVRFEPAKDAGVLLKGKPVTAAIELEDDRSGQADELTIGDVRMVIHVSGDTRGVRVRDPNGAQARGFRGFSWFPIDPTYRVTGRLVRDAEPRKIKVLNTYGHADEYTSEGVVEFTLHGRTVRLRPFTTRPGRLYFVFRDASSGKQTYETARFLYSDLREDGTTVLDFNMAYNPPCAFNPFTTCPVPLRENRLPIPVLAGERAYPVKVSPPK